MIEHDRLLGKGTSERGEVGDLRVVKPGIEGQAQPAQGREAFAELGVIAIEVRRRIGVAVVDLGLLVLPGRGMADALEAAVGCGHVGPQHLLGTRTHCQVDEADDAGGNPRCTIGAAGRHGGDAVDELGLAQRLELGRAVGAIAGCALDEDRALDPVTAARVGEQVGKQIAMRREVPQMVVRIDDGEVRLQDLLAHGRQPILPDPGHPRCYRAVRLVRRHAFLPDRAKG
jgi:hypothetical protein